MFCAVKPAADTTPCGKAATTTCTVAELVNVPKRPNTKPATAMAAMRVIAMRMTVARTGEMAFLLLFPMFIVGQAMTLF
jgi:hypothetical protein